MSTENTAGLAGALAAHGIMRSIDEVDDLLKGVLAAPEGHDPDAWLDLIAPVDAVRLRSLLKERIESLKTAPREPALPLADRLQQLMSTLAACGLDGFVQPLTDEHRNEYIPSARQRLAWLTGFTGSAGTLVVLGDRAVVFVDGRYTVQAEQQLDPDLFERAHLIDTPAQPPGSDDILPKASGWPMTRASTSKPRSNGSKKPAPRPVPNWSRSPRIRWTRSGPISRRCRLPRLITGPALRR